MPAQSAQRLRELIKRLGMSHFDFANAISKSKSHLSQYTTGNQKIGGNFAMDIKRAFPQVNIDWLLTGEGQMFLVPALPTVKELMNEVNALKHQLEQFKKLCTQLLDERARYAYGTQDFLDTHFQILRELPLKKYGAKKKTQKKSPPKKQSKTHT